MYFFYIKLKIIKFGILDNKNVVLQCFTNVEHVQNIDKYLVQNYEENPVPKLEKIRFEHLTNIRFGNWLKSSSKI